MQDKTLKKIFVKREFKDFILNEMTRTEASLSRGASVFARALNQLDKCSYAVTAKVTKM